MFRTRRSGGGGFALLMLLGQIFQMGGFSSIPAGTLALVGLNSYVFLRPFSLPWHVRDAAVNVYDVWHMGQWRRLFLAPFFHADEWHLYYNMASFLWKGKSLEPAMGTPKFLLLNALFVGLSSSLMLVLTAGWAFANPTQAFHIMHQSAIGYSAVIFALKVVTTHRMPRGSSVSIMGMFTVPVKLAVWAELLIASLLTPNASFLGHLSGIIVGLAYVHGNGEKYLDKLCKEFSSRRTAQRQAWRDDTRAEDADRYDADYQAAVAASLSQSDLDAQQRARQAAMARQSHSTPLESLSRGTTRRRPPPVFTTYTGVPGTVNPPDATTFSSHNTDDDADLQAAIAASLSSTHGTRQPDTVHSDATPCPSAPPVEHDSGYSVDQDVSASYHPTVGSYGTESEDVARAARLRRFAS